MGQSWMGQSCTFWGEAVMSRKTEGILAWIFVVFILTMMAILIPDSGIPQTDAEWQKID